LAISAAGSDGVVLTWKGGNPHARYFIERAVGGPDSFVTIGAVNGITNSFVDRGVPAAEEPRYRIVTIEDVSVLAPVKTEPCEVVRLPVWTAAEHHFALRYTGRLRIDKSGKYNFYLNSDDGSRLFIDGSLVVNNDERHLETTVCGTIELEAGIHELDVQYFEADGSKKLEFLWAGALPYGEVPREILTELVVGLYPGDWRRLPFTRSCAVSDVIHLSEKTTLSGRAD
jgi:hypothetical protein